MHVHEEVERDPGQCLVELGGVVDLVIGQLIAFFHPLDSLDFPHLLDRMPREYLGDHAFRTDAD
eukprot:6863935-Prymnesium_polylepis.1